MRFFDCCVFGQDYGSGLFYGGYPEGDGEGSGEAFGEEIDAPSAQRGQPAFSNHCEDASTKWPGDGYGSPYT